MDIAQGMYGIAVLTMSLAVLKQNWDGKKNNNSNCNLNYVKKNDCHSTMETQSNIFNQRIDDLQNHISNRFDDLKDYIQKNDK